MLKNLIQNVKTLYYGRTEEDEEFVTAESIYADEAARALSDWRAAENYFNSIDDPDLVEYALYEVEAAKRKYEYLLRKIRSGDTIWERV